MDFTFIDQIYVGVGGGFAVHAPTCTNCGELTGGVLQFQFGGYPVMDWADDGIRRMGLQVGGDIKINFLSEGGADLIMVQPMVVIGYEAY